MVSLVIKHFRKKNESVPLEVLSKLVGIIRDNPHLLSDLNKLLHSNLQIPILEEQEQNIPDNGNYQDKL